MNDAISTEMVGRCECCGETLAVKMYVLQTGHTAWVCDDCRNGTKPRKVVTDTRPAPGQPVTRKRMTADGHVVDEPVVSSAQYAKPRRKRWRL